MQIAGAARPDRSRPACILRAPRGSVGAGSRHWDLAKSTPIQDTRPPMNHYAHFLKSFGVPEEFVERMVAFRVKDHYYWALEKQGETCVVHCAYDKNNIYDGKDETLCEKIVTSQGLVFRDTELGQTVIMQRYVCPFDEEDIVYVATSLRDLRCVYLR